MYIKCARERGRVVGDRGAACGPFIGGTPLPLWGDWRAEGISY